MAERGRSSNGGTFFVPGMATTSVSTQRTQSHVISSKEIPVSALDVAGLSLTDDLLAAVAGGVPHTRGDANPGSKLRPSRRIAKAGKHGKGKDLEGKKTTLDIERGALGAGHRGSPQFGPAGGRGASDSVYSTQSDMSHMSLSPTGDQPGSAYTMVQDPHLHAHFFHPATFKSGSKFVNPTIMSIASNAGTVDEMDCLPNMEELTNFDKHKQLGTGTDAVVYEVIDRRDKSHVAMKLTKRKSGRYRTEIHLLHQLRTCPFVVKLLKVLEDDRVYVLILEQAPMTLESLLHERCTETPMQEKVARTIMGDVFRGVAAIHNLGFVHKDMKPENVLIFANRVQRKLQAKIADFGFATRVQPGTDIQGTAGGAHRQLPQNTLNEFFERVADKCGTPGFWPPELVAGVVQLNEAFKMDVFSTGVTLYRMLCNEMPFGLFETWDMKTADDGERKLTKMKPTFQVISWIATPAANGAVGEDGAPRVDYKRETSQATKLSTPVTELLRGMLRIRPHRRFDIQDCLKSPWLNAKTDK